VGGPLCRVGEVKTPDIFLTILPSVVIGYLFAGLYIRGLRAVVSRAE